MSRVAALLAAAWLALSPVAAFAADPGQRLESLRKEIEEREAKARELGARAEGYLGELEAVDRELAETRRGAKLLREREREATRELAVARSSAFEAARALAATERGLEQRLVALYKWNATGGVATLWSAGDFASFARRREGMARIVAQDRALFAKHARERGEFERRGRESEALLAEVGDARREAVAREERARQRLVERRNLVGLLKGRAEREEKAAAELRDAADQLEAAIRRMPKSRPSEPAARAPGLASAPETQGLAGAGLARGQTSRPVAGRVRAGFGRQVDPEFKTQTLRTGIEIAAPAGTPVLAVAPGRVLFAGWFRGYGQMVIVDHGGGDLSVSGYLDETVVAAGDSVALRQPIGSVGETGSASGPGLYFEIRHDGKAVDPALWLDK
ncbi:MAG: peptidoglycan DD-metalloendopeptidase family protein [Myxococcota bacterium]